MTATAAASVLVDEDIEIDDDVAPEAVSTQPSVVSSGSTGTSPQQPPSGDNAVAPTEPRPSQTVYVQNINEKIKIPEVKKGIYHVFSAYGNVVDVVASRTYRLRGQAWVVYDNVASAARAIREAQNFKFFNKPLRLSYSKNKSDAVAKADGTFTQRPKRKAEDDEPEGTTIRRQREGTKRQKREDAGENMSDQAPSQIPIVQQVNEPNRILFAENLPADITLEQLNALFGAHTGYRESRLVPNRNVAFVEFENEYHSTVALDALQGHKLSAIERLKLTFAKK